MFTHSYKSGVKIVKQYGWKRFLIRFFKKYTLITEQFIENLYLKVCKKSVVSTIKKFSSCDPKEIYSFGQKTFTLGQNPEEFIPLLEEIKSLNPKIIVEIGFGMGGSVFCFSKLAGEVISINIPQELPLWKTTMFQEFSNSHFIRGDSHAESTIKELKDILKGRHIDCLFIDGDHTYEGVKKDFTEYKNMVKGIIAFHDIHPPYLNIGNISVDTFWKEIKNEYQHKEFISNTNQDGMGIGVLYV